MLPEAANNIVLRVEVMNGLHQGSAADLKAADLTIGPDTEQDIMLVDDEVLGGTIHVACQRSLMGALLSLRTERTDVTLNGKVVPGEGTLVTERLPCEISINGIYLRFGPEAPDAAPAQVHRKEHMALPALIAVGVAALCGHIYLGPASTPPDVIMPSQTAEALPASAEKSAADAGLQTAEAMIAQAGLDRHLTLLAPSSGVIRISGQVPPDLMPQWHELRQDLDQQAQAAVVLTDVKETPALTDLPPVAAVTLGSDPKIIFADKSVAHPGDQVAGQWIVEDIRKDKLRLRRGTERIDVAY